MSLNPYYKVKFAVSFASTTAQNYRKTLHLFFSHVKKLNISAMYALPVSSDEGEFIKSKLI